MLTFVFDLLLAILNDILSIKGYIWNLIQYDDFVIYAKRILSNINMISFFIHIKLYFLYSDNNYKHFYIYFLYVDLIF